MENGKWAAAYTYPRELRVEIGRGCEDFDGEGQLFINSDSYWHALGGIHADGCDLAGACNCTCEVCSGMYSCRCMKLFARPMFL